MPNGDGNENGRKSNRPNKQKKREITLPEQHTFLYISLLLFCMTMFLLARFIRFMEEIPHVLTCSWLVRGCFCRCCCFLFFFFFSLPLIITLVAAYFLTAPRENCHVLLPTKYMIPLRFLSLALALSSVINVNVDIKTYLVEEKTRICCCCCCFFPLKVRWPCDLPLKREGAWSAKIHPSLHEGVDGRTAYGRFF